MKYILREETLSTLIYVFYAYIVISKCFLKYRHKLNPQGLRGTIFGRGKNVIIKYLMSVMYHLSTLCEIFIRRLYFTSSVYFLFL